jgi:hypothetical protein
MRFGPSLDVVHDYETFLLERDRQHPAHEAPAPQTLSPVRLREIVVCDRGGAPRERFARGEDIHIRMRIEADSPDQPVHVMIGVHRAADDLQCFTLGTHADGIAPLSGRTEYEITARLQNVPLLRGDYSIIAFVGDENALTAFDRRDVRPAFSMTSDRFDVGVVAIDHRWDLAPRVEPVAALDRR